MADISFYEYLVRAFRHKLYRDKSAAYFKDPAYSYNLQYEGKNGIFDYARRVFPSFYARNFPDTKEGHLQMAEAIVKKLDLKQDAALEKYFHPAISSPVPPLKAAAVEQPVYGGEPAATMAGGNRLPSVFAPPPRFQMPKVNPAVANTAKNFGSTAGRFFQRNAGKYLTVGRIATAVSTGIGAIAGARFGSIGVLAGAGAGAILPSWVRSGGATKFLGNVGRGTIDAGSRFPNQFSNRSLFSKSSSKKVAWAFLGAFLLLVVFGGVLGGIGGPISLPGEAAPVPGNTGIGSTAPIQLVADQRLGSILEWDQKIIAALDKGLNGLYSRLPTNITNGIYSTGIWSGTNLDSRYWCTYSIVDSYNLAGFSGLSKASHAAVVTMRQFWKSANGYKYLDYPSNNNLLGFAQPGYVIFMESVLATHTGFEHVAMFKTISIDNRGNGLIETDDSNSSQKTNRYPVMEWSIKNTPYVVRGLGGI